MHNFIDEQISHKAEAFATPGEYNPEFFLHDFLGGVSRQIELVEAGVRLGELVGMAVLVDGNLLDPIHALDGREAFKRDL